MWRLAELVRGRVDVQGHAPGVMRDASLRIAVEEASRIAARIVLAIDELSEPFPVHLGERAAERRDERPVAPDLPQDRDRDRHDVRANPCRVDLEEAAGDRPGG